MGWEIAFDNPTISASNISFQGFSTGFSVFNSSTKDPILPLSTSAMSSTPATLGVPSATSISSIMSTTLSAAATIKQTLHPTSVPYPASGSSISHATTIGLSIGLVILGTVLFAIAGIFVRRYLCSVKQRKDIESTLTENPLTLYPSPKGFAYVQSLPSVIGERDLSVKKEIQRNVRELAELEASRIN
jgi:hypothetical protein